ncbi:hypothetical protein [uncultured Rikenella sp.]|uniref:hypothetical protein n=1 Tax=uncultured Rikenella sp. TaxID=368003 RepID=UPI00262D7045|nr:hypothetical protein [uncultured Rikenella sp.]
MKLYTVLNAEGYPTGNQIEASSRRDAAEQFLAENYPEGYCVSDAGYVIAESGIEYEEEDLAALDQ